MIHRPPRPPRKTRPTVGGARRRVSSSGKAQPVAATAEAVGADKPRDMITVVEHLTHLLAQENASLRRHEMDGVRDSIDQKQHLTRAYMEQMIAFRKNPQLVNTLSEDRRHSLKTAVQRLDPLIAENGRLLKARMETINRLMGAIVNAAKDQTSNGAVVYGTGGSMNDALSDHHHLSVALNKEL